MRIAAANFSTMGPSRSPRAKFWILPEVHGPKCPCDFRDLPEDTLLLHPGKALLQPDTPCCLFLLACKCTVQWMISSFRKSSRVANFLRVAATFIRTNAILARSFAASKAFTAAENMSRLSSISMWVSVCPYSYTMYAELSKSRMPFARSFPEQRLHGKQVLRSASWNCHSPEFSS